MKKVSFLLGLMLSLVAVNMNAQQSGNYFIGKWEVTMMGTPEGDIKMSVSIERKDGKLELTMPTPDGSEQKFTDIKETEKSISYGFSANGYDIEVYMEKVDDDNLKGSVANMLDLKGKRVKSN